MLAIPKVMKHKPRKREGMSEKHLEMIRQLPCVVTGRRPVEAHHLLRGPNVVRGMGMKAQDRWAVPVHADVHRKLHAFGNDYVYFQQWAINSTALAEELWDATGDYPEMCRIVELHYKNGIKWRCQK